MSRQAGAQRSSPFSIVTLSLGENIALVIILTVSLASFSLKIVHLKVAQGGFRQESWLAEPGTRTQKYGFPLTFSRA